MSSLISAVPRTSSSVIRSNKGKEKVETIVGRMSAQNVVDDLSTKKNLRIISLSDETGDLPDGIECIARDFADVQNGTISTLVSPMTLSLKKEEHRKKVKITNLKKLKNLISSIASKPSAPFIRFEKVQIMYVPLFSKEESNHGSINVSLNDAGREKAGLDPVIQSVEFEADEMALVELSMDFFVYRSDIEKISLEMSVDRLPIEGRAYGTMFIAFFVNECHNPMRTQERNSTLIYVDSLKNPNDINTTSVFKGLGERISQEVKQKRAAMRQKKMTNERNHIKSMRQIELKKEESSSSDETEMLSDVARKSVSELAKKIEDSKAKLFTVKEKRTLVHNDTSYMTLLDTGAGDHYFINRTAVGTMVSKNIAGYDELPLEKVDYYINLGGMNRKLTDVYATPSADFGQNILSYSRLVKDKIVDRMEAVNDTLYLEKDSMIVMQFDTTEDGRVWLKDDAWKKHSDALKTLKEDEDECYNKDTNENKKKGFGIKYVM